MRRKMDAMFDIEKDELLFIYNEKKFRDREALGYVESIKDYSVKVINVIKDKITEQQYKDLSDRLDVEPHELFDQQSDEYKEKYADADLSNSDILVALKHSPFLLKTPIAVYQDKAYFVQSPYDFVKTGLAFKGIDSDMTDDEYEEGE
jgi:arsenate reductase